MSVNKVQLANGETIIDISDSTVTPETLAEGVTAHDASGKKITGTMKSGGGLSVQADFAQNWETDPSYVKHRPIHDAWSPTVIDDVQLFSPFGEGISCCELLFEGGSLIDGQTYTIRYNGNVYTGVCKNWDGLLFIGSEYFIENFCFEDENDKFCIMNMGELGGMVCFNESISEEVERHLLIINGEDTYTCISKEHFQSASTSGNMTLIDYSEVSPKDAMKGMTIQAVIDGEEQTLTSDVLTFTDLGDSMRVYYGDTLLVAVGVYAQSFTGSCIWANKSMVNSIDFNSPVFAPTLELKRLDEKYMPIITSPSGKKFKISVDDSGNLTATEVTA